MLTKRKFLSGLTGIAQIMVLTFGGVSAIAQIAHTPKETKATRPLVDQPYHDSNVYRFGATDSISYDQVNEHAAITHNQVRVNGHMVPYTTTTGHLTAFDPVTGIPKATMFYVAYTADQQKPESRPVTFFYNGGPGSSSVWLHLGAHAPKRILTGDPDTDEPKPFSFLDNPHSLIDTTDMVFVDAVGTGLSEAITPHTNRMFWGVDTDAAVFRDFIIRYLQVNRRMVSPKYLFGESYGTPRTDVLANLLEIGGVRLTGLILQSAVLNYNTNADIGTGVFSGYVPSYAAVGSHHRLVTPPNQDLFSFMRKMRVFTAAKYDPAVRAYMNTQAFPSADLLTQLFMHTGYPAAAWRNNFNLDETSFRMKLVPGYLLGRYDGRVIAPEDGPLSADGDPSDALISQPFTERIRDYLPNGLKYSTASSYNVVNEDTINVWDWSHDGLTMPDTIPDLASAIYQNPKLKVLAVSGYHDLATPFYITEQDLGRLGSVLGLQIRNYPGGHMTYLYEPVRPKMKEDLVKFYDLRL